MNKRLQFKESVFAATTHECAKHTPPRCRLLNRRLDRPRRAIVNERLCRSKMAHQHL
jgi:hypothetical protein